MLFVHQMCPQRGVRTTATLSTVVILEQSRSHDDVVAGLNQIVEVDTFCRTDAVAQANNLDSSSRATFDEATGQRERFPDCHSRPNRDLTRRPHFAGYEHRWSARHENRVAALERN